MKDNTNLSNDKEFLKFIKREIKKGYVPLITIKEMDRLINKVASWYEFKYPIRYFIDEEFAKNNIWFKNKMTVKELLLRLNYEERQILKCEYTSTGGGTRPIYKSNKIVDTKPELFFQIINHNYEKYDFGSFTLINFDPETGLIYDDAFSRLYTKETYSIETIEELYRYLVNKNDKNIDFKELERIIKDKQIDKQIREYVIKYIEINIMQDSIDRAYLFKKEFNEYIKEQNKYINYEIYIKNKEKQLTKKKKL